MSGTVPFRGTDYRRRTQLRLRRAAERQTGAGCWAPPAEPLVIEEPARLAMLRRVSLLLWLV